MRFLSHSAAQTEEFACDFARGLHGGDVVAFRGGLGMGKTAFVRGALRGLGNTARVSSPTFALVNDYGGTPHIYHFDMYRVTDWDSLYSTGFFDYLTPDEHPLYRVEREYRRRSAGGKHICHDRAGERP